MTNEEAIKTLQEDYCGERFFCELHQDGLCNTEDCEIWWAINALENAKNDKLTTESAQNVPNQAFKMQKSDVLGVKTGETCSDTISRQAAIDVILADKIDNKSLKVMDALGNGNEAKTLNMTCDRHAELLKSLPSAQPEPIKITIDHVPTKDELERLKQAMRNTPVMLLPSTQPKISPDGTLNISIDADIASVGRILLSQAGTQYGGLYYKDEEPEETCDTCKHGYFGDGMCDKCRVRYQSHYERRTDGRD